MKLICQADERVWAEVKERWSRNDLNRFNALYLATLAAQTDDGRQEAVESLKAYYLEVVSDIQVVDINDKTYNGLEAVFEANTMGDLDGAVSYFLETLPSQAYKARQRLGNAKRLG